MRGRRGQTATGLATPAQACRRLLTGLHARPKARVWGGSQLAEDHHTVPYLQRMPMWQLVTLSRSYSLPHS